MALGIPQLSLHRLVAYTRHNMEAYPLNLESRSGAPCECSDPQRQVRYDVLEWAQVGSV